MTELINGFINGSGRLNLNRRPSRTMGWVTHLKKKQCLFF